MEEEIDFTPFKSSNGIGVMEVMDKTGDTKTIWDSKNPEEVENAQKQFDYFTKTLKYVACAVGKKGEPGEQLKKFDPELERIIFVKPLAGG